VVPDLVPAENVLYMGILTTDGEVSPQNNIYFRSETGAMDAARGKVICQAVFDWYASEIMPLVSSEIRLFHVIGIDMSGIPHLLADSDPRDDVLGGSSPALPLVLCLRVDFKSGLVGRWYNGRNFLAGIPEDKCVKSHIDADWAESVRLAYNQLFDVASSVDCTWVVVSRSFGGVTRLSAAVTSITEVVIPDLRVRTYRQRIARFGT
jgi:hypothetical protein